MALIYSTQQLRAVSEPYTLSEAFSRLKSDAPKRDWSWAFFLKDDVLDRGPGKVLKMWAGNMPRFQVKESGRCEKTGTGRREKKQQKKHQFLKLSEASELSHLRFLYFCPEGHRSGDAMG